MRTELTDKPFIYIFDHDISTESVNQLIGITDMYETVHLYFSTNGGSTYAMPALIDYLNQRVDEVKVFLVGELSSTGIQILKYYTGPLYVTREFVLFQIHLSDSKLYTTRVDFPRQKEYIEELSEYQNKELEFYVELGLTSEEIKTLSQGGQVTLLRKDLKRLSITNKFIIQQL